MLLIKDRTFIPMEGLLNIVLLFHSVLHEKGVKYIIYYTNVF